MKKIGIITVLSNSSNYGGCLQAYATERFLLKNSYDAKHIICKEYPSQKVFSAKIGFMQVVFTEIKTKGIGGFIKHFLKVVFKKTFGKLCRIFPKYKDEEIRINTRENAFIHFREEVILHTERVYNINTISECNDFDVYITGSDEVWRIEENQLLPTYWLTFVPKGKKKISYAASLSMPAVPDEMKDVVRDALKDYTAISVRQNSDRDAIQELTDKPVEWVLDPTLLLTADDWLEISAPNKFAEEKYIFTYILGDSKEQRECVERFAKLKGLKIINIPYLLNVYRSCDRKFGNYRVSNVSPDRWISLIHDAEYIFTDSFHGSVFSILFHKKFYTFLRDSHDGKGSRNSRIYSLFEMFGLKDRLISSDMSPKDIMKIDSIDYDRIENILALERKKSSDFLLNAINL